MQINWSDFHSTYTEEEVKRFVPVDAGVYLLCVKLKDSNNWKCFYVGRAINLEERLLEHLSFDEENECIKKKVFHKVCGFEYAIVSEQNNREGIEKFLYDHYGPECNLIDPGGRPMEVNLP